MTNKEIEVKITQLLDEMINPAIAGHGGSVKLVKFEDGLAYLEMFGGCQGCAGARMTLQHHIEGLLKAEIPEISQVVDCTDHDAGENPFYKER